MEHLTSGLKNIVTNVIAFVAGNNDESESSASGEVVDCCSDCSICNSENRSISLPSSKHSSHHHFHPQLVEDANQPAHPHLKSAAHSMHSSLKRKRYNDHGMAQSAKEEIDLSKMSVFSGLNKDLMEENEGGAEEGRDGKNEFPKSVSFGSSSRRIMNNPLVSQKKRRFHEISGHEGQTSPIKKELEAVNNSQVYKRNSALTILDQQFTHEVNEEEIKAIEKMDTIEQKQQENSKHRQVELRNDDQEEEVKRLSQSFEKNLNIQEDDKSGNIQIVKRHTDKKHLDISGVFRSSNQGHTKKQQKGFYVDDLLITQTVKDKLVEKLGEVKTLNDDANFHEFSQFNFSLNKACIDIMIQSLNELQDEEVLVNNEKCGYSISNKSLKDFLNTDSQLNDETLKAYTHVVNQRQRDSFLENVYVFDHGLFKTQEAFTADMITELSQSLDKAFITLKSYKYLVFPVVAQYNNKESKQVIIIIIADQSDNKFFIFNQEQDQELPQVQNVKEFLKQYYQSHQEKSKKYSLEENLELWIEINQGVINKESGLTTMLMMEYLGRKGQINEVENYIQQQLFSNKDDHKKKIVLEILLGKIISE